MHFKEGYILKGIGGFYYVESNDEVYECKARGIFRKENISPVAGDKVKFSLDDSKDVKGVVEEIFPRKNFLIRPPIANIDQLLLVVSTCEPKPNMLVIDKLLAVSEYNKIKPIIVISKVDLENGDLIYNIYRNVGIETILFSSKTLEGLEQIKEQLKGKVTAFTGNSGVGKSTLLNCIDEAIKQKTGITSKKLGRGKHTNREVELFKLKFGGYVADTPGFSSVDIAKYNFIRKEEIARCFPEFIPYIGKCKYASCSHTCENGCAIIEEKNKKIIEETRYNSYFSMYESAKAIKEWEIKKKGKKN